MTSAHSQDGGALLEETEAGLGHSPERGSGPEAIQQNVVPWARNLVF